MKNNLKNNEKKCDVVNSENFFFTGTNEISMPKTNLSELPAIPNDRYEEGSLEKRGPYLYPIANLNFSKGNDLMFKILHPERKSEKNLLLNFNTNSGMVKSYSCSNLESHTKNYGLSKSISQVDCFSEHGSRMILKEKMLTKLKKAQNNPYTLKSKKFFKKLQRDEMEKRSNCYDKVIKPVYEKYRMRVEENRGCYDHEQEEITFEEGIDDSKRALPIPKFKDFLKKKYNFLKELKQASTQTAYNLKALKPLPNLSKEKYKCPKSIERLSSQKHKRIKMSSTYIRDLKIMAALYKMKDNDLLPRLKLILHDLN